MLDNGMSPTCEAGAKRSYTINGRSAFALARDGWRQWQAIRALKRNAKQTCLDSLQEMRKFAETMERECGMPLCGLRTLEIGHGQSQLAIAYMTAKGNRCVGIDLDVTPRGLSDFRGYWQMLKANGFFRTAKSVAREMSGINVVYRREYCRQMNWASWPAYDLYNMDVCGMSFGEGEFDFVYSTDVFEHLDDPGQALREVLRVLKPGGSFYLRFLHHGHYNALHDLRWITGAGEPPPPWAHLVPALRDETRQGAFVNRLFVNDWRALFAEVCPGSVIRLSPVNDTKLPERLREMRAAHADLNDYADDELLANYVCASGTKPAARGLHG